MQQNPENSIEALLSTPPNAQLFHGNARTFSTASHEPWGPFFPSAAFLFGTIKRGKGLVLNLLWICFFSVYDRQKDGERGNWALQMPRHSPSLFPLGIVVIAPSPLFHFISAEFPNPPPNPISPILLGMFLIAKIVRGRRLLHQLEQEVEKEKAAKALEQREKLAKFGLIPQQQDQNHALGMGQHQMDSIEVEGGEKEIGGGMAATSGIELAEMGGGGTEWEIKPMSDQQQAERVRQRRKRAVRQRTDSSLPSGEETDQALAASREQAMRRTSSMPSIVECEQHLHHLHLPHHQLSVFPRKGLLNAARPIRHYNYEDKLSKLQKRALRFTWQRLLTRNGGKRIESVFEEVFDRMMRSLPIMREMFNTRTFISAMSRCEIASPRDHARLIVKMFEMAIKNLEVEQCKRTDTTSDFDPKLLGQAHSALRPYGFTSALWEAFGEAVIDIVLNQEAVRDLPGASQAWVVLTACLVDQLRAGFESVRECPFKRNQQKENQQMNGREGANQGGVADEEGGGGGMALAAERHNQNQQLGEELALYQQSSPSGRRRTITLAEEEECLAEGIGTLGAAEIGHHFGRERRSCFSIMPGMEGGNGGKEGGESAHSRVQLKFLQDMASTEL